MTGFTAAAAEPQSEHVERLEINTTLMETTFQIYGPSAEKPGDTTAGTVFIMGRPIGDSQRASYVLITAAHVLDGIAGDFVTLRFHAKNEDGSIVEEPFKLPVRQNGKALYVRHPEVDVAALYVRLPSEFQKTMMLPINLLGSDEWFAKFEIHPGDELLCLGYPLFAAGPYGYPILRSGKIASYPLLPAKQTKNWLFDFRVFPGNSGGPVYFVDHNRTYDNNTHLGETIAFLAGLVTAQVNSQVFKDKDLSLGVIIPAVFIRETLDMLPEKSPYE